MIRSVLQKSALLLALAAPVLFNSCSTDINLLENYKPITVVYGLLNVNDSIQYIKVNKAFLGEGNAIVMAQQGDSINYKPGELTVQLQQLNPSTGEVLQTITCDTTTQIPKSDGLFSNPYQMLFKTNAFIDESSNYKVLIDRAVDGVQISAVTPVVDSVEITFPTAVNLVRFYTISQSYVTFVLKWKHSADAEIYSTRIRFTYYDSLVVAPFTKDTITLEINLPDILKGTSAVGAIKNVELKGLDFYNFIDASVNPNPNAVRWADDELEISLSAGAEDLNTYIEVNKPSLGIIQEKPVFSNITNGTGIFSSRWKAVIKRKMDSATLTKANDVLN